MERFEIMLAAHSQADEGYLLHTAAKMLTELQAMGTKCCLTQAKKPWQLAMAGCGDISYIRTHVCDLMDGKIGSVLITKIS